MNPRPHRPALLVRSPLPPLSPPLLALLALLALLVGCRGRAATPPPAPDDPDRFPHALHRDGLGCADCHSLPSVLAGAPAQPGADDHAPCDRAECHQAAFLIPPGKLCSVCHERVDPTRSDGAPLVPYPRDSGRRALASSFSHAQHLDVAAMERAVGFHVSCLDCHSAGEREDGVTTQPEPAGHRECARCHAPETALADAPAMDACEGCHRPDGPQPARQRRFIVGDLSFDHRTHVVDRAGARISCLECHVDSPQARTTGDHPLPTTAACVACHDDQDRAPQRVQMQSCGTCHSAGGQRFADLAPRSHLPAAERPEDHTLAFRSDHGDEARHDGARCARCHTQMSGSPRDTCDECHQTMRPHDHVVTWREFDHGGEGAADPTRCATCHTANFCVGCHSDVPRSHRPLAMFRDGAHGAAAMNRPRACAACHDPVDFCGPCHEVDGP